MKDKSRFLSSVIVSFLAGFIYLLAGENSTDSIQSSVRAVLSTNGPDLYLTAECFPFYEISKKSDPKISGNISGFYLKQSETVDKQYSGLISGDQAKFIRPLPDKNIDFTSELKKLINKGSDNWSDKNIENKVITDNDRTLSCNEFQIADAERNFKRTERINKQNIEFNLKYDEGNGFNFNNLTEDISGIEDNFDCNIKIFASDDESISEINVIVTGKNINRNVNKNINRNRNDNWDCREKVRNYKVKSNKKVVWNNNSDNNDEYEIEYEEEFETEYNDCGNHNNETDATDRPGIFDPM